MLSAMGFYPVDPVSAESVSYTHLYLLDSFSSLIPSVRRSIRPNSPRDAISVLINRDDCLGTVDKFTHDLSLIHI